jgi:hypothetical protein
MKLQLLQAHNFDNNQWLGLDSEELYKKNLEIQPENWEWRNKKFSYTMNSQGYRASEWDQIDWNNSILVFGCSQVFGVGVPDDQTMCAHLNKILGINVVNLGIPGGSFMSTWINTEIILNHNIKPIAVIYNWPMPERTVELFSETKNRSIGPWSFNPSFNNTSFGHDWILHPTHSLEYAKYVLKSVRRSWNCPQLHYSWDMKTAGLFNLPRVLKVDTARDMSHNGPLTCKAWAETWAANLSTLMREKL